MITVPDRPLKTEADFSTFFRDLDSMAQETDRQTRGAIKRLAILTGRARRIGVPVDTAILATNDLRTGADHERHNAGGVDIEFAIDWQPYRFAWGGRCLDSLCARNAWHEARKGPAPKWWNRPHTFFSLTKITPRHHPTLTISSADRRPGIEVLWKERGGFSCDHDTRGKDLKLVTLFTTLPAGTYDLPLGLGLMDRMWRLLQLWTP